MHAIPTNNCNRMITTERSIQADYTAPLPAIHMTQHQSLLLLQNRPIRQSAHCQCYWQKGWAPPEIHSRNRIRVKDMCCKKKSIGLLHGTSMWFDIYCVSIQIRKHPDFSKQVGRKRGFILNYKNTKIIWS